MNTNETKHTPGPWKAVGLAVHQVPPGGREIIFGAHNTRGGDKDERQANAHLIAAAPELLDALYTALNLETAAMLGARRMAQSDPTRDALDVRHHFDAIRAAIAKAEGR